MRSSGCRPYIYIMTARPSSPQEGASLTLAPINIIAAVRLHVGGPARSRSPNYGAVSGARRPGRVRDRLGQLACACTAHAIAVSSPELSTDPRKNATLFAVLKRMALAIYGTALYWKG